MKTVVHPTNTIQKSKSMLKLVSVFRAHWGGHGPPLIYYTRCHAFVTLPSTGKLKLHFFYYKNLVVLQANQLLIFFHFFGDSQLMFIFEQWSCTSVVPDCPCFIQSTQIDLFIATAFAGVFSSPPHRHNKHMVVWLLTFIINPFLWGKPENDVSSSRKCSKVWM